MCQPATLHISNLPTDISAGLNHRQRERWQQRDARFKVPPHVNAQPQPRKRPSLYSELLLDTGGHKPWLTSRLGPSVPLSKLKRQQLCSNQTSLYHISSSGEGRKNRINVITSHLLDVCAASWRGSAAHEMTVRGQKHTWMWASSCMRPSQTGQTAADGAAAACRSQNPHLR